MGSNPAHVCKARLGQRIFLFFGTVLTFSFQERVHHILGFFPNLSFLMISVRLERFSSFGSPP